MASNFPRIIIMRNFVYSLFLFVLLSCSQNSYEETQRGDVVFVINDKIKSISPSSGDNLWIGSAIGKVYNTSNGKIPLIEAEEDVYSILDDISGNNCLYVCVRDNGVQQWSVLKNGEYKMTKQYRIKVRGHKYSPYASLKNNGKIYYGTSNGIYKQTETDSLELIYPSYEILDKTNGEYPIRNIVALNNEGTIAASTPEGVIIISNKKVVKRLLINKDISYVSYNSNNLYVNANDTLYTIDLKDSITHKKRIASLLAFINTKANIGVSFTLHKVSFHDCTIKESYDFSTDDLIQLEGNSRSGIFNDTHSQTVYYASGNKLIALPYQGINIILNKSSDIIELDSNSTYAISNNILFNKNIQDSLFKQYLTLPDDFQVEYLAINGNDIIVADKNRVLKMHPRLFSSLKSKGKELFKTKDINGLVYSKFRNSFLIASRYGTFELKSNGASSKLNDYYIKSIRINTHDKKTIYLNTQNKGVVQITSNDSISSTSIYTNYRDIDCFISGNETKLEKDIILSKSKIIIISDKIDTIPVPGVFSLTVINKGWIIGTGVSGILYFKINEDCTYEISKKFNEISFIKNSCKPIDDQSFYISSKYGTWIINHQTDITIPKFKQNISEGKFKIILVSVIIVILLLISLLFSEIRKYVIKKRASQAIISSRKEEKTQTLKRSAELKIKELKLFTLIFNDDSDEIIEINRLITDYEDIIKNNPDEFENYVNNLSKSLNSLNRVVLAKINTGLPFMKNIPSIDGLTAEKLERANEITKELLIEKKHEKFIYFLEQLGDIQAYFESHKIKNQIIDICNEMKSKASSFRNQDNALSFCNSIEDIICKVNSLPIITLLNKLISLKELFEAINILDYTYLLIKQLENSISSYENYAKTHSYDDIEKQKIAEINDLVKEIRRSTDRFFKEAPLSFINFILNDLKMNNSDNQQSRYLVLLLADNTISNIAASKVLFRDSRDTKSIVRKRVKEFSNNNLIEDNISIMFIINSLLSSANNNH